jgi:hypothetical protein
MRIAQAKAGAVVRTIRERETPRGDRIGTEFSNE